MNNNILQVNSRTTKKYTIYVWLRLTSNRPYMLSTIVFFQHVSHIEVFYIEGLVIFPIHIQNKINTCSLH